MEIIAYNTSLDISSLLKNEDKVEKCRLDFKRREFENNKKALLPFIFKYIHYLVEINNGSIIKSYQGHENARLCSIGGRKLDLTECLELAANNCHFQDNGALWEWDAHIFNGSTKIWLNNGVGKHVATPEHKYSMGGFARNVYARSIEDYVTNLVKEIARVNN